MKTHLLKEGSTDKHRTERNVTVRRVCGRGRERRSDWRVCGSINFVQDDVGQSVVGRTKFSYSGLSVLARFMQLSWKVSIFVYMRSTGSKRLSRNLGHNSKRNWSLVSAKEGAESF